MTGDWLVLTGVAGRLLSAFGWQTVAALVEVLLCAGVGCCLCLAAAVAVDVYGGIDGLAHRLLVGLALAGYVIGGAVVRRSAHIGESGGEVHAVFRSEEFEGYESLVVIHGQDAVKLGVGAASEKNPSAG